MRLYPLAVALLLLASPSFSIVYIDDPRSDVMGELKKPPKTGKGVVVRCQRAQMNRITKGINRELKRVRRIKSDMAAIGETTDGIGDFYGKFPPVANYFKNFTEAVAGRKGLIQYLGRLEKSLQASSRCIYDNQYLSGGCRYIPNNCYEEKSVQKQLVSANQAVERLTTSLKKSRWGLVGSVDEWCYKTGPGVKTSRNGRPPCREHLSDSLRKLIQAQETVENRF